MKMTIEQYIKENLDFVNKNEVSQYTQSFLLSFIKILFSPFIALRNIVNGIRKNPPKFKNLKDIFWFIVVFVWMIYMFYLLGLAFFTFFIYPILITQKKFSFLSQNPLVIVFSIYIGSIIFGIIFTWQDFHGLRKKIIKKHLKEQNNHLQFDENTISKAAEILKEFKSTNYAQAIELYEQRSIDLLIITNCIGETGKSNKLGKIISLKALEEDREANESDDAN